MYLTSSESLSILFFFFFNDTATTEIYTLSLHDALPISWREEVGDELPDQPLPLAELNAKHWAWLSAEYHARKHSTTGRVPRDRKSTRLNSSHLVISYAVFCLKKKKRHQTTHCHT